MSEAPLLTLTDVAIERGGVCLASGIGLTLGPGQALILRGPNGSGKTTLLRTVAGLQPPLSGTVQAGPEAVAYAAHSDGIKATLTVTENLTFWAAMFGTRDIRPALDAFALTGLANRPAGALSAGQKRRLGLARLLVTGRPLWVLDEPTVALDAASVALFAKAVTDHLGQGGAALIATHIDLGLDAPVLDMTAYPPMPETAPGAFDEALT